MATGPLPKTGLLVIYRIVPIKGASPNKAAPYGLRKAQTDKNEQNCPKILNNCPIFNLMPPLKGSAFIMMVGNDEE